MNVVGIATFIVTDGHFGFIGYWDDETSKVDIYAGGWGSMGMGFVNLGYDREKGFSAFGTYFWDPNPPAPYNSDNFDNNTTPSGKKRW